MARRNNIPYRELPLSDNFIFGEVMSNAEVCTLFLEALLGKPIAKIEYISKEQSYADTLGMHGIRLDVYIEDENNTRYDIEMQCVDSKALERRIRYYQGGIDRNFLRAGGDYIDLPESYVIFICDFDHYGAGLALYERECILKGTGIQYDDGSHAIILNTKYSKPGDASKDILEFLDYVRTNDGKVQVSGQLTKLARALCDEVRSDEKKEEMYMTLQRLLQDERREAKAEGKAEGRAEGKMEALIDLYLSGDLPLATAASKCGLSEDAFLERAKK